MRLEPPALSSALTGPAFPTPLSKGFGSGVKAEDGKETWPLGLPGSSLPSRGPVATLACVLGPGEQMLQGLSSNSGSTTGEPAVCSDHHHL